MKDLKNYILEGLFDTNTTDKITDDLTFDNILSDHEKHYKGFNNDNGVLTLNIDKNDIIKNGLIFRLNNETSKFLSKNFTQIIIPGIEKSKWIELQLYAEGTDIDLSFVERIKCNFSYFKFWVNNDNTTYRNLNIEQDIDELTIDSDKRINKKVFFENCKFNVISGYLHCETNCDNKSDITINTMSELQINPKKMKALLDVNYFDDIKEIFDNKISKNDNPKFINKTYSEVFDLNIKTFKMYISFHDDGNNIIVAKNNFVLYKYGELKDNYNIFFKYN
jgi:hypothetical protein